MRTKGQVKQQLKQVVFRHLQKVLRGKLKQSPATCRYNRELSLSPGSEVHLCGVLNSEGVPRHVLCDARLDACTEMARECPLWEPIRGKELLKSDFHKFLRSGDRGKIAARYPDIAALMWVLDNPEMPSESEISEMAVADPPVSPGGVWGWLHKLGASK